MAANNPKLKQASGTGAVTVSDWNVCYNSGDNAIALSCRVTAKDPIATISGVGLILNNSKGVILCSTYTALSGGTDSVNPSLNLPPNGLKVGDKVWGVVSGEVAGNHYFFEEELTIGSC